MAESHDRLTDFAEAIDRNLVRVMPDYWVGHGRLKIAERGFEGKRETFAIRLLDRLSKKHPDTDAEKLAEKVVEVAEGKDFD